MTNSSKIKVYQEVLDKIRHFIEENQLSEGDRLPSERELADQLNAGRSSVREALRAIELLGLIETRHGEGTFLKTYRPYHTVELLATFVLRQSTTKEELLDVMQMLEQQCLERICYLFTVQDFKVMENQIQSLDEDQVHSYVFNYLFEKVENQLLLKIWHLVNNFSQATHKINQSKELYLKLLKLLKEQKVTEASKLLSDFYHEDQISSY